MSVYFNSHAHVERDASGITYKTLWDMISTHTLTWSVTGSFCLFLSVPYHFNSHAHVERDAAVILFKTFAGDFNSHAHVERDPMRTTTISSRSHFNSHAHVERDNGKGEDFRKNYISTHTLTWSVTS